jgi:hypothetical protein
MFDCPASRKTGIAVFDKVGKAVSNTKAGIEIMFQKKFCLLIGLFKATPSE